MTIAFSYVGVLQLLILVAMVYDSEKKIENSELGVRAKTLNEKMMSSNKHD